MDFHKRLLGCYVLVTNIGKEEISKEKVVDYYKSLSLVDRAFRIIKTTLLNIRPIYHRKEERIIGHVMICIFAYYVVVEMKKRLKLLFKENGVGKDYALTFKNIIEELSQIKVGKIRVKDVSIQNLSEISSLQKKTIEQLGVELKVEKKVKHE